MFYTSWIISLVSIKINVYVSYIHNTSLHPHAYTICIIQHPISPAIYINQPFISRNLSLCQITSSHRPYRFIASCTTCTVMFTLYVFTIMITNEHNSTIFKQINICIRYCIFICLRLFFRTLWSDFFIKRHF